MNDSPFVFADDDMVTLVLRNLLSNAIKFTPEHCTIIIRLKTESKFCRVSVMIGIGMDQEAWPRIQDSYSTNGTAKESGTGLGL